MAPVPKHVMGGLAKESQGDSASGSCVNCTYTYTYFDVFDTCIEMRPLSLALNTGRSSKLSRTSVSRTSLKAQVIGGETPHHRGLGIRSYPPAHGRELARILWVPKTPNLTFAPLSNRGIFSVVRGPRPSASSGPHGAAKLQGIRSDHQVDQPDVCTRARGCGRAFPKHLRALTTYHDTYTHTPHHCCVSACSLARRLSSRNSSVSVSVSISVSTLDRVHYEHTLFRAQSPPCRLSACVLRGTHVPCCFSIC